MEERWDFEMKEWNAMQAQKAQEAALQKEANGKTYFSDTF